jgi:dihydrolipoamide dehydrogenase
MSPTDVVQRISKVKHYWNQSLEESLNSHDVHIVQGKASFAEANRVEVQPLGIDEASYFEADAIIVASGSVPLFPPELKPDGKKVIAPRFSSHLSSLPRSMIVVGAGPTGCETVYLFNRFGVKVTWIVDQFGILPQMHPELGVSLGTELARQGVHVVQGQMVERLEQSDEVTAVLADGARYGADMAFVAIGRKPDWARLNLEAAGLIVDAEGQIPTDEFGRTVKNNIYLVGDAAGGPLIANKAMAQARIAARHAAGESVRGYDPNLIVNVTYTEPQVAQVGAVLESENVKSVRVPFSAALKTNLLYETDGFLALFYDEADQKLKGATALGPHAADVLTPVAVALSLGASVRQMAEVYAPHPTLSELPFVASRKI